MLCTAFWDRPRPPLSLSLSLSLSLFCEPEMGSDPIIRGAGAAGAADGGSYQTRRDMIPIFCRKGTIPAQALCLGDTASAPCRQASHYYYLLSSPPTALSLPHTFALARARPWYLLTTKTQVRARSMHSCMHGFTILREPPPRGGILPAIWQLGPVLAS